MTDPQINTAPIKRLILSGFPLLLLGLAGGFVLHRALPPPVALPEHEAEVIRQVSVSTVAYVRGNLTLAEPFFGAVAAEPASVSTISSRAGGLVLSVLIASGHVVQQGDVILQFDPAPLQAATLTARGALTTARNLFVEFERSGRDRIHAELIAAEAKSANERKQAEADVVRLQQLRADGLVAEKTLSDATFAAQRTALEHELAQRSLRTWRDSGAEFQLDNLKAADAAAAALLQQAEQALAEAVVKAPVHGRVLDLFPRAGDHVEAFAQLGSLLLDNRRIVVFSASAAAAAHLVVGAKLVFADPNGKQRTGRLVRIAARAGVDGLVEIVGAVDGTDALLPGAHVHGEVETEQLLDVVIVPAAAVLRIDSEDHCICCQQDGTSRKVVVEILGRRGDSVAIKGDVTAAVRVVVDGGYNLPDGTKLLEATNDAQGASSGEARK